jgi:hypothetical protein
MSRGMVDPVLGTVTDTRSMFKYMLPPRTWQKHAPRFERTVYLLGAGGVMFTDTMNNESGWLREEPSGRLEGLMYI